MRIEALQLIAFGPFTDQTLDFGNKHNGFHLVYGPNEAGKSSALRALRQLFYGIPERSDDDFLHPYAKMRIGAVLSATNGNTLQVIRRKGRAGTLRAADDTTAIKEIELQNILQGVDAELFTTMFGISHEDLVRGGKDIIQGGGDVGRLVFSAGSGIANLREIQAELQAQADALFRPAGQKPIINEAISLIKTNQKQLRESQLTGQQWAQHDKALHRALSRKQTVETELVAVQKDQRRLQRIDEALPLMARRKELVDQLEEFDDAILLPVDFADKRRELQSNQESAKNRQAQAEKAIASLHQELKGLNADPALLDNSELIEELHRELGSQRKAATDKIGLDARYSTLRNDARQVLRNLRDDLALEQAETVRIKKTDAIMIQKLAGQYERIHTRIEDSRDKLPELDRDIASIDKELAAMANPRSIETLRESLSAAVEFGPLEKHHRIEQIEIESAAKTITIEQAKLGLEAIDADALEGLKVPTLDTVAVFEEHFGDAKRRFDTIDTETQKVRGELASVQRQIEASRLEQEVPTEDDLKQARKLRDHGWTLIDATLGGHLPSEDEVRSFIDSVGGSNTLAGAFATTMSSADELSDRLRREAARVQNKARLLADQNGLQDQLDRLEKERQSARTELATLQSKWEEHWKTIAIKALTPREMAQWVRDYRTLTDKVQVQRNRRAKAQGVTQQIATHQKALYDCLQALGEREPDQEASLERLIKRAGSVIADEQKLTQDRLQLEKDLHGKKKERATAAERLQSTEAELRDWQDQWRAAVEKIGLAATAHPDQAAAFMEESKSLFEKLKEADILQKRIQGIDWDAAEFAQSVAGLSRVVAANLSERPAQEGALELHQRLKRAREAFTKKEALQKQLALEQERFDQAAEDRATIEIDLKSMCAEAGCNKPGELIEAEQRSDRRRELESELRNIDDQLRRLSAGVTVEAFIQEAVGVDADAIAGKIKSLQDAIENLEREKSELDQTIGSEANELSKMDGTSRAAGLAQDIQVILGGIENHIDQYVRLKIAAKVLSMAIERYREKSQGPILTRASELFGRITGGSFAGLRAEIDSTGKPAIVGVRAGNGEIVTVDGMSDGTADQLYLALRLSGLEMYLGKNEPLPFIVDDILIMFDDNRSAATLKVLAELSEHTQVIFFTHHRHLVDLAGKNIQSSVLIEL